MNARATVQLCLLLLALSTGAGTGCADTSRGTVGESCRARNDCRSGLACINEVCVPGSSTLTVTGKGCYRVQCAGTLDCCADFVPAAGCDSYEAACQADPNDCEAYRTLCRCNRICVSEQCLDVGPGCAADAECPTQTAPYCVTGRCVACREHGDCLEEGARCISGTCKPPCRTDSNCPPLHACQAGACVPSGCTSDRECAFVLGHSNGRCSGGGCFVGCDSDSACNASNFEVCLSGRCTFVGCNTDAECRAYLNLSNTPGQTRAVCR